MSQLEYEIKPMRYCGEIVPGYFISSFGDVLSAWIPGRKGIGTTCRPLAACDHLCNSTYYRQIVMLISGKRKTLTVHRLVLEAFVSPPPDGMEARHFPDRDGRNNRRDNLSWGTKQENMADKLFHGTSFRGSRLPQAKLNERIVAGIRREYAVGGVSIATVARKHNVAATTVQKIICRETWAHVA